MRKKSKWKYLALASVVPFVVLPFVSSAVGGGNTGGSGTGTGTGTGDGTTGKPVEKKPINARELNQNKQFIGNEIPKAIDDIVTRAIQAIDSEIATLKADTEIDEIEKITRSFYISKVKEFLNNNLDKIKANPQNYGFMLIYPNVFADGLRLNSNTLTYGNRTLQGFSTGQGPASNYSSIIPASDIKFDLALENTLNLEDFQKLWTEYKGELDKGSNSFLLNNEDRPTIGKELTFETTTIDGKTVIVPNEPKGVEGVSTWDEYIISKIKTRFFDFDLEQNLKQNTPENPPVIVIPPVNIFIPGETAIDVPVDLEIIDVPNLRPIARPEFANLSPQDFVNQYTSASQEQKAEMLFFNNPLQDRFNLTVNSIVMDKDSQANASVTLKDTIGIDTARDYRETVKYLNLKDNSLAIYEYAATNFMKNIFDKIRNIFTLDKKLNFGSVSGYDTYNNRAIVVTYYGLTKIYFSVKFTNFSEALVNEYAQKEYTAFNFAQFKNRLESHFLSYLKNSKIDTKSLISYMSDIVASKVAILESEYKKNVTSVQELLATLDIKEADINQLFAYLKEQAVAVKNLGWNTSANASYLLDELLRLSININDYSAPLQILYDAAVYKKTPPETLQKAITDFKSRASEISQTNNNAVYTFAGVSAGVVALIAISILLKIKFFKRKG
ncbi:MSC_0620 family F1-like ATPase-associated subunit [Mycoplasmopsis agassizii]|uniref:MSC_0620 family F1-like ATPase-associated subunit n=1 Tax=Mycoplasmopsis agassizii TaxID=33922 RepID=UPI003528DED9